MSNLPPPTNCCRWELCPLSTQAGCIYDINGIAPTVMENHGTALAIAEPIYGSSRLNALIASGKVDPTKTLFLDCYNQQSYESVAPTITTRVDRSNHYLISEQTMNDAPQIRHIGNIRCKDTHGGVDGDIFDPNGIVRTLNASPGGAAATYIVESPNLYLISEPTMEQIQISEPAILRMERTEEEKLRRSLEGDSGAKFSSSKILAPRPDGISNTLTQSQKDNMLIEPLNDDNGCARTIKAQHQHNSSANFIRQDGLGATAVIEGEPIRIRQANEQGYIECPPGGVFDASYPNSPTRRGSVQDGGEVTPTICSAQQGLCLYEGLETPSILSHPLSHAHESPRPHSDYSPTLRATDYKAPPCAIVDTSEESTERIIQVGNIVPDHPKFKNRIQGRIYAPEGLSPTLNTHTGGGLEPKIAMPLYRIRKLTPRECFRLMDVDDESIDLIQSAGISNSQQYKLAGNSIVVSCLYHIFHKMFIDTSVEEPLQLSLFDF